MARPRPFHRTLAGRNMYYVARVCAPPFLFEPALNFRLASTAKQAQLLASWASPSNPLSPEIVQLGASPCTQRS